MKILRVGSRESRLAVAQAEIVINQIKANFPNYKIELVTMKTTGDKILDRTLDKVGGKGLFVKELDRALLSGEVDITVHSLKDMPMETDKRLPIIAYCKRESPFDVLVLPKGVDKLDISKPIGCAGLRRRLQLKRLYPDMQVKPIRGNVITRLEKLDCENSEYSALVLALAGLKRLGLDCRISKIFTYNEMLPACGQGIIAVQGRADMEYDFIQCINDRNAELSAIGERAFVQSLNGGCSSPVACFTTAIDNENITLRGLYADEAMNFEIFDEITGKINGDVQALGRLLAERIKNGQNQR